MGDFFVVFRALARKKSGFVFCSTPSKAGNSRSACCAKLPKSCAWRFLPFFASFPTTARMTARARFCARRTRAFERKKQIKEGGGHTARSSGDHHAALPQPAQAKKKTTPPHASRLTTHRDVTPLTEATATPPTVIGFCARAALVRQLLSTRDHRAMELRASRQIPETRAHAAARAHTCVWRTDGLLSRVVTAGRVASAAGAV